MKHVQTYSEFIGESIINEKKYSAQDFFKELNYYDGTIQGKKVNIKDLAKIHNKLDLGQKYKVYSWLKKIEHELYTDKYWKELTQ
jgi:hypothetical protein